MFGSSNGGSGFGGFGQQPANNQQQGQTGGLFGQSQPAQTNTPAFGGFGANQPQQTTGFGASTSGTGSGLFGQAQQQQQQQPSSSGFSFGQSSTTPNQPFGQTAQNNQVKPAGFGGFGASTTGTPSNFGGFGSNQAQQPAFGASTTGTNAFGAKPAGSLFGQPQTQTQTGAFGQPATSGGLFGNNAGLSAQQTGGMPTQGTSNPPYQPFVNTEKDANGTGSTNYQYNTITCLPAYRNASVEELRLQDYQQGRKSGNMGPGGTSTMGGFGQPATSNAFGSNNTGNSLFGGQNQQTSTGFGGAATSGGLFGQNNQTQQQNTGLFGSSTNTNTTGGGLFGQPAQQQSGGLFGQNNTQNQQQGSTGFSFGQTQPANNTGGFTFGQNNQQQNKPGGLFGGGTSGFGTTNNQPSSSGFTFGGNNATQQQQNTGFGGAQTSTGGFGFGATANANQPKPGGLFGASSTPAFGGFGASTTAASTDANKPAFSFGGGGGGGFGAASSAPGQTATAAPTGGLFGNQQTTTAGQSSTGFSFGGAAGGTQNQNSTLGGGTTGSNFSFGGVQTQPGATTTGFGSGNSLFGQNKPATGGLFGASQTQQQPGAQQQTGSFNFGGANNTTGQTTGGGLFGQAPKPATGGLFGGGGGLLGSSQTGQTGGLFGSNSLSGNQQGAGTTGGLFGGGQGGLSGGLFGNNQSTNTAPSGGLFGGTSSFTGAGGLGGQSTNSLFGQTQNQQSGLSNLQTSLNMNPYGTDSLFGGAASGLGGSVSNTNLNARSTLAANGQAMLPFNVSKPPAKKQPPLVPPFRPSPRNSIRIAKLRGTTPGGFRESTPAREGTPSLFASSPAFTRLSSPSIATSGNAVGSLFRGLSDDSGRSQREASVPPSLPSQAFVGRSSVKRLVLDDQANRSMNVSSLHGRSQSLFGGNSRTTGGANVDQNANERTSSIFDRSTPSTINARPISGQNAISFSPALEMAAASRTPIDGLPRSNIGNTTSDLGDESSFTQNVLGPRRNMVDYNNSPSKGAEIVRETSLPSLKNKPASVTKMNKEDVLLPLDYYTVPPLSELREWSHAELRSVEGFIVGRKGFGSVEFLEPVDLTTVGELNNIPGGIVQLRKKECFVYPDEEDCFDSESGNERDGVQPGFDPKRVPGGGKAPRGEGLNVPAVVHLEGCWPLDRSTRQPIKELDHPRVKQMVNKLRRRNDLEYKDYEPKSGTWSFKVEHFSRYGLDGEEEEEEDGNNASQKNVLTKKDDGKIKKGQSKLKKVKGIESKDEGEKREEKGDEHLIAQKLSTGSANPQENQMTSTVGQQPWAATLGLEARRMQVMQASFFGDTNMQDESKMTKSNRSRMASPSLNSMHNVIGSRANFNGPMNVDLQKMKKFESIKEKQEAQELQNVNLDLAPPLSVRPRKITKLVVEKSVTDDGHGATLDAGLMMGRSFRVGWGPNGTFVYRSKVIDSEKTNKDSNDNQSETLSTIKMGKLKIFKGEEEKVGLNSILEMLKVQFDNSVIEIDEEILTHDGEGNEFSTPCPVAFPNPALRFKHFLSSSSSNNQSSTMMSSDAAYTQKRLETAIFRLASSLFDEIDLKLSDEADEEMKMQVIQLRRKNQLTDWIRWYSESAIRADIRRQIASPDKQSGEKIIFSLLSGGFFEESCKHALEIGNVRLATLLAQVNGGGNDDEFRLDLIDQLSVWRASGVDVFISNEHRRIMELLSGNVMIGKGNSKRSESGEKVEDICIFNGLDWIRTFALFLHYDAHFEEGIGHSISSYESCIGKGLNDQVIVPPLPSYLESQIKVGSKRFRDLIRFPDSYPKDTLFALLKTFSQKDFPLEGLLDPLQYGSNPLNFSIAFHISQILSRVLGIRDFNDRIDLGIEGETMARELNLRGNSARHDNLCIEYAMQLELMDQWTWAAFILLHLEMPQSRKANILALLSRNVDKFDKADQNAANESIDNSDEIEFLTKKLHIPIEWIFEARANAAANRNDRYTEYKLLLRARLYSRAHRIAVIFLAPEGIIRHDFTLILDLFAPFRRGMEDLADDGIEQGEIDVPGWQAGGQIFLDYIAICRSLPWLVATHASNFVRAVEGANLTRSFEDREIIEIIKSSLGPEAAEAARKIEKTASKIPTLFQKIDDLFNDFIGGQGSSTTLLVARSQMVASLHNCVRSLQATRTLSKLASFLPSLDVDLNILTDQVFESSSLPIEIENLHFITNAYCNALVEGDA